MICNKFGSLSLIICFRNKNEKNFYGVYLTDGEKCTCPAKTNLKMLIKTLSFLLFVLLFLLVQFGSKIQRLLYMGSNTSIE
jgi:hypothetical protein